MNHKKIPTLTEYIQEKIRIIEEEFCIRLTEDERDHLRLSKSERDADQYAHDIFMRKL